MAKKHWEILPHFILRSTGFPYNQLENLAFSQTSAALDALLDCEDKLATLFAEIHQTLSADDDPETRKIRRRYRDLARRKRPFSLTEEVRQLLPPNLFSCLQRWDPLLNQCRLLKKKAEDTFAAELIAKRSILRDVAADPPFQEAVWLSSPQMYKHGLRRYLQKWQAHKRPSETRRIERQIISYLQRFCAKNDTAGFFGPVNYGDFAKPVPDPLAGPGHQRLQRRQAFVAYWAIQAIAETIADDPETAVYLQPYRTPLCQLDETNSQLNIGHKVKIRLQPPMMQILQQVDGERTITQIAHNVGLENTATLKILQQLAKARAVAITPPIPVTTLDPLDWLQDWVKQLPAACATRSYWCETITKLKHLQARFAIAPFDEKQRLLKDLESLLTDTTQQTARRGGGEFYADRLMIYEESLGGVSPLSLGPKFADELTAQLTPVLNLCAAHACEIHEQQHNYGVSLLSDMIANGKAPLLHFVAELSQREAAFKPTFSRWQAAILEQLAAVPDCNRVQLDLETLPPIDNALPATMPLLTSPDVMLLAEDEDALRAGNFQVILAECHDTFMIWGWALYFHPDRAMVKDAAGHLLSRITEDCEVANVLTSKRVKIVPFEYPGPTIEMLVPSKNKSPEERIAIADVEVGMENGRLTLTAPGKGPMMLYNGELPTLAHSLFALPKVIPPRLQCAGHTPRVTLGNVILQRERWQVSRDQLFPGRYQGASFAMMHDFRRAALDLKLPRYFFVSVASEPKPVFIDSDNYFLLEFLYYLMPENEETTFTEMLPTPDQLWLRHHEEKYCAELRLSAGYVSPRTAN